MSSEDSPEWLPDGWIMGLRTRKDGRVDRYYTSPVSGATFRSKPEVMRYLNVEKVNGVAPRSSTFSVNNNLSPHNNTQFVAKEDSPLWLPDGWILEIRTRKSGKKAGSKYKCYFDPTSGSRFYSKTDVFRYLEGGHDSNENRSVIPDSPDNVLAQVECSPEGLPSGWIKEVKFRRNSSGLRKDPYYRDPVSGYVFRSKKDVFRYLETGEISRHAFKPRNKNNNGGGVYSIEESPPPIAARTLKQSGTAARRCLFVSPISGSNEKVAEEIAQLPDREPSFQNSGHDMPQRAEGSSPNLITMLDAKMVEETTQVDDPEKFHISQVCASEMTPEQIAGKFSGSTGDKVPDKPNEKMLESVDFNIEELKNGNPPGLKQGELFDPAGASKATTKPSTRRTLKKLAIRRSLRNKAANGEISGQGLLESSHNKPPEPANKKLSEPEELSCELLVVDKGLSVANELPGKRRTKHVTETTRLSSTRAKKKIAMSLPCRASRRLAGLEAAPSAKIEFSDQSLRRGKRAAVLMEKTHIDDSSGDQMVHDGPGNVEILHTSVQASPAETKGKEPIVQDPTPEEHPGYVEADMKQEPSIASPFGDAWPPCIEFAFKTLTGDIPVFEETAMEDYFHQHVSSVKTSRPYANSSLAQSIHEFIQADTPVQLDSVGNLNTTTAKAKQECSMKNGTEPGGKVNRKSKMAKVNNYETAGV